MAKFVKLPWSKAKADTEKDSAQRIVALIEGTTDCIVVIDASALEEPETQEEPAAIVLSTAKKGGRKRKNVELGVTALLQQAIRNKGKPASILYTKECLIPYPNDRKEGGHCHSNSMIFGPSGAGKSYYCWMLVGQWQLQHPGRPVFLISKVENDDKINQLKPLRIALDADFIGKPIEAREQPNSLYIFDDCERIADKNMKQTVQKSRDNMLTEGRHHNLHVVSIVHNGQGGHLTQCSLSEADTITMFPRGGDRKHILGVLKNYVGLETHEALSILKTPNTRWITVCMKAPRFYFWEHGCKALE